MDQSEVRVLLHGEMAQLSTFDSHITNLHTYASRAANVHKDGPYVPEWNCSSLRPVFIC